MTREKHPETSGEAFLKLAKKLRYGELRENSNPIMFTCDDFTYNYDTKEIQRNKKKEIVPGHTSRLLEYFISREGLICPHEELIDHIWGSENGSINALQLQVSRLRYLIEPNPKQPIHIKTRSRFGYYFQGNPKK